MSEAGAGGAAQWVERSPIKHEVPAFNPRQGINKVWGCALGMAALGRWKQEHHGKAKAILGYILSSRLAWTTY